MKPRAALYPFRQACHGGRGSLGSRGISRFTYQLWLFGLSAFFSGLAGAVYVADFRAIGPDVFSLTLLLLLLSMIVMGGLGTIWGPLLGATLLMLIDEGMKKFSDYCNIGLGAILAAFVILLPRGLVGALAALWRRPPRRGKPVSAQ